MSRRRGMASSKVALEECFVYTHTNSSDPHEFLPGFYVDKANHIVTCPGALEAPAQKFKARSDHISTSKHASPPARYTAGVPLTHKVNDEVLVLGYAPDGQNVYKSQFQLVNKSGKGISVWNPATIRHVQTIGQNVYYGIEYYDRACSIVPWYWVTSAEFKNELAVVGGLFADAAKVKWTTFGGARIDSPVPAGIDWAKGALVSGHGQLYFPVSPIVDGKDDADRAQESTRDLPVYNPANTRWDLPILQPLQQPQRRPPPAAPAALPNVSALTVAAPSTPPASRATPSASTKTVCGASRIKEPTIDVDNLFKGSVGARLRPVWDELMNLSFEMWTPKKLVRLLTEPGYLQQVIVHLDHKKQQYKTMSQAGSTYLDMYKTLHESRQQLAEDALTFNARDRTRGANVGRSPQQAQNVYDGVTLLKETERKTFLDELYASLQADLTSMYAEDYSAERTKPLLYAGAELVVNAHRNNLTTMIRNGVYAAYQQALGNVVFYLHEIHPVAFQYVCRLAFNIMTGTFKHFPNMAYDLNILLYGPAGTGKTDTARGLALVMPFVGVVSNYKSSVVALNASDLQGTHVGESFPKTTAALRRGLESVTFLDEAYQATEAPSYGDGESGYGPEVATAIVQFLSEHRLCGVFIAAGYADEMQEQFLGSNSGMPSRFNGQLETQCTPDVYWKLATAKAADVLNEQSLCGIALPQGMSSAEKLFPGCARGIDKMAWHIVRAHYLTKTATSQFNATKIVQIAVAQRLASVSLSNADDEDNSPLPPFYT